MDEYRERSPIDGIGIAIVLLLLFAGLATGMGREMVGQVGAALKSAPPLVQVQIAAPPAPSWAQGAPAAPAPALQVNSAPADMQRAPGYAGCPADAPYLTLAGVCTP